MQGTNYGRHNRSSCTINALASGTLCSVKVVRYLRTVVPVRADGVHPMIMQSYTCV